MECSSGTSACAVKISPSSRRDPSGTPHGGGRRKREHRYSKPSSWSAVVATGNEAAISQNGTPTLRNRNSEGNIINVSPSTMPSRVSRVSRTFIVASVSIVLGLSGVEHHGALALDTSDTSNIETADTEDESGWITAMQYVLIVVLVMASGLFSGLTLGLLGLDKIGLEIIGNGDEPRMAAFAKKIQPVRADGNLLLCTLLLGNVAVNALLSIVMAELTSGIVGFALATGIITIFGEIVPQAVCSRHALRIGSMVVPLVKVIILILYPITKPLSIMLDKMLGDEIGTIHSRTELTELLKIHVKHGALDVETGRELAGAMTYKERAVRNVMTPAKDCFMLSLSEKLNFKTLSVIFQNGFSRIPVFGKDRNDVIGLLFTKDLIFIDPDDETPLENFVDIFGRSVTHVWPDYALGDVLKMFKQGKSHMGLVKDVNDSGEGDPFYEVVGIITLEDIIEEILGDEIVDETDAFVDMETQRPVERREFDMSRLRLLNAQADTSSLSSDEAKSVSSYLTSNVPQLKDLEQADVDAFIAKSPVVHVTREVSEGTADPAPAEVLYRRGRTSTVCTLILTGRVVIRTGKDGFQSDAGPWSVLAADALVEEEGTYKPDFSAHVGSEQLRYIRISKVSLDAMSSPPKYAPFTPLTVETGGIDSYRSIGSSNGARSAGSGVATPLSHTTNRSKGQGRFSPAGIRAVKGDGAKSSSASFKIRQALTVAVMNPAAPVPGEKSGKKMPNARVTQEEKKDAVVEKAEVAAALGGERNQDEESVPKSDYTTSHTTDPDSNQNL